MRSKDKFFQYEGERKEKAKQSTETKKNILKIKERIGWGKDEKLKNIKMNRLKEKEKQWNRLTKKERKKQSNGLTKKERNNGRE